AEAPPRRSFLSGRTTPSPTAGRARRSPSAGRGDRGRSRGRRAATWATRARARARARQREADRMRRALLGSGAFVPRGEVLRLLLAELVDRDAHRLELQAGDLLVDLHRHRIDLVLE